MQFINKKRYAYILLFLFIIGIMISSLAWADDGQSNDDVKTVRVGFCEEAGGNEISPDGVYSGFNYELIEDLARYNNWKVEYVGYNKTWNECLQMLEDGDVDLLTQISKTSERKNIYTYSDKNIGSSITNLVVKKGNQDIYPNKVEDIDGKTVGMLAGSSINNSFEEYAQNKGIEYQSKEYNSYIEVNKALDDGVIDLIVQESFRNTSDEMVILKLNEDPFYIAAQKGNTELIGEVNSALDIMDVLTPNWRENLVERYYSQGRNSDILFSSSEEKYLRNLATENDPLQVLVSPGVEPYSYYNGESMGGIIPALFQEVADRTGLSYEYVVVKNQEEYNQALTSGQVDIVLDWSAKLYTARRKGYELSDSYLTVPLSSVCLKGNNDGQAIAVPESLLAAVENTDLLAEDGVESTLDVNSAIENVINKKFDCAYLLSYSADAQVAEDEQDRLESQILPGRDVQFFMAIQATQDNPLMLILNKGIASVTNEGLPDSLVSTLSGEGVTEPTGIVAEYYHNPTNVLLSSLTIFLVLLAGVAYVLVSKSKAKTFRNNKEQDQLLKYLCKLTDVVLEANLVTNKVVSFTAGDDGEIVRKEGRYDYPMNPHFLAKLHPNDRDAVEKFYSRDHFLQLIDNLEEDTIECRVRNKEGAYSWSLVAVMGIHVDEDHPCNVISFVRDVEDLHEESDKNHEILYTALQQARSASQAKGDFLSRMSHEIRTPLNAVLGYLDVAELNDGNPKQTKEALEEIRHSSKHLLEIINDVLDMSAIESGNVKLAHKEFDILEDYALVLKIYEDQCKEKGITFVREGENEISRSQVVGDGLRLRQIGMNLLSNAVKFTEPGGTITHTINEIKTIEDKTYFKLTCKDTGRGITPEFLKKIYEPFDQESAEINHSYGGSGLGLSITHNLVTLMGGTINIKSTVDEGSIFTVVIPFENGKAQEKNSCIAKTVFEIRGDGLLPKTFPDYKKAKVLVAEDNKINQTIIAKLLEKFNVKVEVADNGKIATEMFEGHVPGYYKMIFMDVRMPVMGGYEATSIIRKMDRPDASMIPIIASTANVFSDDVSAAAAAGMNAHLPKPNTIQAFAKALEMFLE